MINPWKILGTHRESSSEEIRNKYRELMKVNHPDAGGTQERSAEITEAYTVLTTPKKLKELLDTLKVWGVKCVTCKGKGYTFKQKGLTQKITTPCNTCGGAGIITKEK